MASVTKEVIYKDFDIKFTAHPVTGKLIIKKQSDAVKQGLKNLILTNLGERPYKPSFGSSVRSYLFENYTAITESHIRSAIKTAVDNYGSRVILVDIIFGGDPDHNELEVSIIFREVNSTTIETINIQLERVR